MASTSPQFVRLEPDRDLEFRRPFNGVVKQVLFVKNTHPSDTIAFKVKTTAPKQYCVRPNSGKVQPGGSTEVHVLLQPFKEDPPLDFKCKDKFLIQSIKVPASVAGLDGPEFAAQLTDLWTQAEQLKKAEPDNAASIIQEKKLKCTFLPPLPTAGGADVPSVADALTPSGSTSSTPQPRPATPADPATTAYHTASSNPAAGGAPATTTRRSNTVSGDPDRELREARETIKRLTAACEGYKGEIDRLNQLRQRRSGTGSSDEAAKGRGGGNSTALVQAQGLNIQVVALIALIAFILGVYLF
ncbi:PapD-like protein [Zopfochytrium polystomum]|nr:PapD-like protein [Zopfochytrium polystomum]